MGFWFNNFQEFEKKLKGENHLILNFYYVPSEGEQARRVKVRVKRPIKIPTGFLFGKDASKVVGQLIENPELRDLPLNEYELGRFRVFEIEIPKIKSLTDQLPGAFQVRDYDKMLRLSGFFPERKAVFSPALEKRFQQEDEIDLDSLDGISSRGDLSADEIRNMPWLYLDIEKPLWKHDDEKKYLKWRKKILKQDKSKKHRNDGRHEKRARILNRLEDKLTISVEGVGQVRLWEDAHDASISFITTCWKNILDQGTIRELYVLDPRNEFQAGEVNGYKVLKFRTEYDLISYFLERMDERKPVMASGHNEVYDITQIRAAADENKLDFNPAVKGFRPRRDFVRKFLQRLREDLIYSDSMNLNAIFFPWLRQRRFSNLKLETVSQYHGINFKKSLTHDQLREVELQRLSGTSPEARKQAAQKIAEYAAGDVEPVVEMIEKLPFTGLITKLKQALPFCTRTQIAFHPNCVNTYHDWKHFQRCRNKRYYKYKQKERENEIQIFKKRFPMLKRSMLEWAGIQKTGSCSLGEPVYQVYLPFEEWIKDLIFKYTPEFKRVYENLETNEKIPFLQYLKALEREILVDYYFTRRDEETLKKVSALEERVKALEKRVNAGILGKYYESFRYLKNHFRSIYVDLKGDGRKLIRTTKSNLTDLTESTLFEKGEEIPESMISEADLFLLREKHGQIRAMLSPGKKAVLSAFLKNFETLEKTEQEVRAILTKDLGKGLTEPDLPEDTRELLYLYNQQRRFREKTWQFKRKYGFEVSNLTKSIAHSYRNLARELKKHDTKVIDIQGDYMTVHANPGIKSSPLVYLVREFPVKATA